jgi:RNA polymerase sigma-70 factor (ECF subfamily)
MTADQLAGAAVAAAPSRDEEFRGFYAEAFPAVAGYCLALTGDASVADEIAQEAFVATYVRWRRLDTPRGFAFRVARNLAATHWRRRQRELASWSEIAADSAPATTTDTLLWDAVRRLPPRQRDVLVLHYLYDLPVADVATALRRSPGTVKRQLHEGRALLQRALEGTR